MFNYRYGMAIGLAWSILTGVAQAVPVGTTPDTRPAAPQQRQQWEQQGINLQLSGSLLQGNLNLINAATSLSYNLNLPQQQIFLDFGNLYTQAGDAVLANRLNGSVLYAYNLASNFNAYGYSTHTFDQSIKLDYRLTNGAGVCLHQIGSEFLSLGLISAGLATENEWFKSNISQFALRGVLRLALSYPLTDFAELGLDSFYTPNLGAFSDYRLYGEAFVKFKLTENLSLKLSVADEFDSAPQPEVKNNDFGVFTTVSMDFGV